MVIPCENKMKPLWGYVPFEIKIQARVLKGWELQKVPIPVKEANAGEGIDNKQVECGASVAHHLD